MVNFGSGIAGAITGSASAGIPGAIAGGVLGLFGNKKKKKKKLSTFDPRQQALYQQHADALEGKGPLSGLYNFDPNKANQNFEQNIARPAYRNYEENIIPKVTGQFRQNNLMRSSYAGEALSRHGRDIQEDLNAKRSDYLYRQEQDANTAKRSGIENMLNRTTFDYQKPQQSTIDQILNAAGPATAQWFSDYLNKKNSTSAPTTTAPPGTASATY